MPSGFELGKAWFTVGADSSELPNDLNTAGDRVRTSLNSMSAMAAGIFAAIYKSGSDAISSGLSQASNFEKTTVEMETMLGSASEAKKTLADLTQFAVETPFQMPQLLSVAQGMIQFGERGDDLMKTIKMIGDASGGTAEKFGLLGLVFNQIRGVGHLVTQDFRQLSTRGIISLQDIAKYYKVSTNAAQGMLSNGKISFNDFKKIMTGLTQEGGRFANMMVKQSTTLEGLSSTMKDAINISFRQLATPLVPYVKAWYTAVIQLTNAMAWLATNGGEIVSFAVALTTVMSGVAASFFLAQTAAAFFGTTVSAVFKKLLVTLLYVAPWLVLVAAIGAVVGYVASLKVVTDGVSGAWKRLTEYLQIYYDYFVQVVSSNKQQLDDIARLWAEAGHNISRMFSQLFAKVEEWWNSLSGISHVTVLTMTASFLNFVVTVLDYVSLFTANWELTWELIKVYALTGLNYTGQLWFSQMNWTVGLVMGAAAAMLSIWWNMSANAGEAIWWIGSNFKSVCLYIGTIIEDITYNLVIAFKMAFMEMGVMAKAFGAGLKSALTGGDFWKEFDKSFAASRKQMEGKPEEMARVVGARGLPALQKAFAANKPQFNAVVDPAVKAFQDAWSHRPKWTPFDENLRGLKSDADLLWGKAKKERDKMRAEEHPFIPGEFKLKTKGAAQSAPAASMFNLTQGRFGFAEIGTKIQDLLLKGNQDTGQQTVDLLGQQVALAENGNNIQKQILDKKGGLGP